MPELCKTAHVEVLKVLLEYSSGVGALVCPSYLPCGMQPLTMPQEPSRLLHLAAMLENCEFLKVLLDAGADVNSFNDSEVGYTLTCCPSLTPPDHSPAPSMPPRACSLRGAAAAARGRCGWSVPACSCR